MIKTIIRETYQHLNELSDLLREPLRIPGLIKTCVLYVHAEVDVFEERLLRRMIPRRMYDYALRPTKILQQLETYRTKYAFIQEYFGWLQATFDKTWPQKIPASEKMCLAFYCIYGPLKLLPGINVRENGCRRRRCFLTPDTRCICDNPIV